MITPVAEIKLEVTAKGRVVGRAKDMELISSIEYLEVWDRHRHSCCHIEWA